MTQQQKVTNKLAAWLGRYPKPMKKIEFARELGVKPQYITHLCRLEYPWVTREKALKIAEITKGEVTPNDLCGYDPSQAQTG